MKLHENLPQGAEFELRSVGTLSTTAQYTGNSFDRIESTKQTMHTVRLQHQGKLSTASSSKPGSEGDLIQQALTTVPYGSPHSVPFVGEAKVAELTLTDDTTLSSKEMIEMLGAFVAELRAIDKRVEVSARLISSRNEVSLTTSCGFNHSYSKTIWSCAGMLKLVQGDDLLHLYEVQTELGPNFDLKQMKDELTKQLSYAEHVVPFTPGAYPVIFAPDEAGIIINPIVQSLNGMAVCRQMSPWGDKLGQMLLDSRFNLVDDGSLDGTWTSSPFDSEGTPTRRNVLVQNGRLGDLLLDRKTASLLGKESSGNAGATQPMPHHLRLTEGTKTLDELIASIDYGMLICNTMGAWSGNPFAGVVSGTVAMGLRIEKGKIVGRVKDCMFTINAFQHFQKHLLEFSKERKQVFNNLFPYVLLDEVVISTK